MKEALWERIGKTEQWCSCGGEGEETAEHLFFQCAQAKLIWNIPPFIGKDWLTSKQILKVGGIVCWKHQGKEGKRTT